ncbi:Neuronal PAS [Homalodisca vitripennis]|nr:Neuronal PAS [Homalodisca vitripennis]
MRDKDHRVERSVGVEQTSCTSNTRFLRRRTRPEIPRRPRQRQQRSRNAEESDANYAFHLSPDGSDTVGRVPSIGGPVHINRRGNRCVRYAELVVSIYCALTEPGTRDGLSSHRHKDAVDILLLLDVYEDLLIHGDSVYDMIDKQDHQAIQTELVRSANTHGEDNRLFLCRMNVSRNARRQMRFGDQKIWATIWMSRSGKSLSANFEILGVQRQFDRSSLLREMTAGVWWGSFPNYQRFLLASTRVCHPLPTWTGKAGLSFFRGDMTLRLAPTHAMSLLEKQSTLVHQQYRLSAELRRMLQEMLLLHISLWLTDDERSTHPLTLAPSSCNDTF